MESEILIYQTERGDTKIEVRLENENVWLSQAQMAILYQTIKQNINLHLKNVFKEGELDEALTVKDYLTDATISIGYRVDSHSKWTTQCLGEYLIKGFTLDAKHLKSSNHPCYFRELPGWYTRYRL